MTHPTSPVFLLHSSQQEFKSKQGDNNASIGEPNSGNPLPDSPYFFFEDPTFIASMAKALIPSIIKGVKHSFHPSDQPYGERMIYEQTTGNSLDKVPVSRGGAINNNWSTHFRGQPYQLSRPFGGRGRATSTSTQSLP